MTKLSEKEKEIARMSINDIINSSDLPDMIDNDLEKANRVLDKPTVIDNVETYSHIKDKAHAKAVRTIDALLKFYLSEEIIEEEEYIKAKIDMDKLALSKLVFLMETSEKSIITLMKTIDSGDMDSKMFEVLAALQKTLLDIIKSQTMFMIASEESMKRLSRDIDVYGKESSKKRIESKTGTSTNKGITTRGTKDLMRALQGMGSDENNKDSDTEFTVIPDEVVMHTKVIDGIEYEQQEDPIDEL